MKKIYKVTFTDLASTLTDLIPARNEVQAIEKVKKSWGNTSTLILKVEPYTEVQNER